MGLSSLLWHTDLMHMHRMKTYVSWKQRVGIFTENPDKELEQTDAARADFVEFDDTCLYRLGIYHRFTLSGCFIYACPTDERYYVVEVDGDDAVDNEYNRPNRSIHYLLPRRVEADESVETALLRCTRKTENNNSANTNNTINPTVIALAGYLLQSNMKDVPLRLLPRWINVDGFEKSSHS